MRNVLQSDEVGIGKMKWRELCIRSSVKASISMCRAEGRGNLWLNSVLDRSGAKMKIPKRYNSKKATASNKRYTASTIES
jgi:hypothetical protein